MSTLFLPPAGTLIDSDEWTAEKCRIPFAGYDDCICATPCVEFATPQNDAVVNWFGDNGLVFKGKGENGDVCLFKWCNSGAASCLALFDWVLVLARCSNGLWAARAQLTTLGTPFGWVSTGSPPADCAGAVDGVVGTGSPAGCDLGYLSEGDVTVDEDTGIISASFTLPWCSKPSGGSEADLIVTI